MSSRKGFQNAWVPGMLLALFSRLGSGGAPRIRGSREILPRGSAEEVGVRS